MNAETAYPANGLIAVDWGTSRLRAKLLGVEGTVLAERESHDGIGRLDGGHEAVLERLIDGWPQVPAMLAGMIGSRQGWREVAYLPCPTTPEALGERVVRFETSGGRAVAIVPGLATRSPEGQGDVIRGEETQIVGLIDGQPGFTGICILPGTHSKWATIADGAITGFRTFLTGELFDLLARRSILRHSVADDSRDITTVPDFATAVKRVGEDGAPVLSEMFSVRARGLLDGAAPGDNWAYLSGLLIGGEIAAATASGLSADGRLTIVSDRSLARAYEVALTILGRQVETVDGDRMALAGLVRMARTIGFLEAVPA